MIKTHYLISGIPSGVANWWNNYIKYIMELYGLDSYYESVLYMDHDLRLHWNGSLGSSKISSIAFHAAVFADEQSKTAFLLRFG